MPFEILNRAFVFLRCCLALERAEIFRLPVLGSFFREYSRYLPDFSFLIIHDSLGAVVTATPILPRMRSDARLSEYLTKIRRHCAVYFQR